MEQTVSGGITPVKNVGSDELKAWREKAWKNSEGGRQRDKYGVSRGARQAAPEVEPTKDGNYEVEAEARGAPRAGRELAKIMERRRQEQLDRMLRADPDAKMKMVQHLRATNPGLLADYPDDTEAVKHLNDILRAESNAIAKRALIRDARDATILYGR
jgi:hypothetical protein